MSSSRYHDLAALMVGLAVFVADQLTKLWIVGYFGTEGGKPPIPVVGDTLTLYYVQNTGVAFSLFAGQNLKFVLIGLALALISYLYWRFRDSASLWLRLGFALVFGGAAGNLFDRFARSYVVDFVHFQIPGIFNFAVFNLADSAITIGVLLVALCLYRQNADVSPTASEPAATRAPARAEAAPEQAPVERK